MPSRRIAILALVLLAGALFGVGRAEAAFLSAAAAVTDAGDPSPFGFSLSTPIDPPLDAPVQVTLTVTITVTDATGDGASISLVSPHLTVVEASLENVFVVGLGAPVSTIPGSNTVVTNASTSLIFAGGLPPYDSMELQLNFLGSGGNDIFSIDALLEVEAAPAAVPEPTTMSLIGAGALLVALRALRRVR